jgi:hypothetical protein
MHRVEESNLGSDGGGETFLRKGAAKPRNVSLSVRERVLGLKLAGLDQFLALSENLGKGTHRSESLHVVSCRLGRVQYWQLIAVTSFDWNMPQRTRKKRSQSASRVHLIVGLKP